MAEPLLKVEHLKKYFHTNQGTLHAVDDVSFTLNKGETLGVVGESGCGKSTLEEPSYAFTSRPAVRSSLKGRKLPLWASWR